MCHIQCERRSGSSGSPCIYYTFISSALCRIAVFTMGLFSREAICLRNEHCKKLSIKNREHDTHMASRSVWTLIITAFPKAVDKLCDQWQRKQTLCLLVIYEAAQYIADPSVSQPFASQHTTTLTTFAMNPPPSLLSSSFSTAQWNWKAPI